MMRALQFFTITLGLTVGVVSAATLQGDRLRICDQSLDIPDELQPSTLLGLSSADLDARRFALVYESYAQAFEKTLAPFERADPGVARVIANLRGASTISPKAFGITPAGGNSEKIFESRADEITLSCAGPLTARQVNMAAVALMTGWVRSQEVLPTLDRRAQFIVRQSKAHEALINNGLPMWPWELWLNGKQLGESDADPLFKTQWVLMRPTVGFEINTLDRASANLNASVGVEPLGFIRYQDDSYRSWWGASLLITSSNQSGLGVGGLLRWNNYVLGVTRHDSGQAGVPDSNFVFIGIELSSFLNSKREDFEQWKALQNNRLRSVLNGQ